MKRQWFLISPISHHHDNHDKDNEYQFSESEVWHFAQVVEPEVEEGGVDPHLVCVDNMC